MEPISKPRFDKVSLRLPTDIKAVLRRGDASIYDILQKIGVTVNGCAVSVDQIVDWMNESVDILVTNENERIAKEAERQTAEAERAESYSQISNAFEECEEAARIASEAAETATEAIRKVSLVNVTLNGNMLSVTNKDGVTTQLNIKGDKGDTGKSAYEQWLSEGNTGTYNDFMKSIIAQSNVITYLNDLVASTFMNINQRLEWIEQNATFRGEILGSEYEQVFPGGDNEEILEDLTQRMEAQEALNAQQQIEIDELKGGEDSESAQTFTGTEATLQHNVTNAEVTTGVDIAPQA